MTRYLINDIILSNALIFKQCDLSVQTLSGLRRMLPYYHSSQSLFDAHYRNPTVCNMSTNKY